MQICGQGKKYDEFDLAGLSLTEEQIKNLRIETDKIISALNPFKTGNNNLIKQFEILGEYNKQLNVKINSWKKKRFYE